MWGDMGRYGEIRGDKGRYGRCGEIRGDGEIWRDVGDKGRYGEIRGKCGEVWRGVADTCMGGMRRWRY